MRKSEQMRRMAQICVNYYAKMAFGIMLCTNNCNIANNDADCILQRNKCSFGTHSFSNRIEIL